MFFCKFQMWKWGLYISSSYILVYLIFCYIFFWSYRDFYFRWFRWSLVQGAIHVVFLMDWLSCVWRRAGKYKPIRRLPQPWTSIQAIAHKHRHRHTGIFRKKEVMAKVRWAELKENTFLMTHHWKRKLSAHLLQSWHFCLCV